ncbi:MAG: transposase [Bacilli bacterium]|nr:transposase [Bacilli bacterium]
MKKNIEELTLLLMYLTSWEEEGYVALENGIPKEAKIKTCWKGYSFDVVNKLMDEKYLYFSKYKNKSVSLTPEGEKLAKKLIEKYLK